MIPERQIEMLIAETISEVTEEAINADGGPMIKFGGIDLDQRAQNMALFKRGLVMALMKALKTSGAISVRPEDPRERAVVRDPRLQDSLREGFDEGRERPKEGTQTVVESDPTPLEKYEQLQLPGFEDEPKDEDDA